MVPSICYFTLSLNWNTDARIEIVKQWIMPQSNLFKQHDHTTVMSLLIFLVLSQSHHKKITYFKYIIHTHNFLNFFSALMFYLYYMIKVLRQMKKLLYIWQIDYSITWHINLWDSKYSRQYQIHSRVFFGENCLWSPCFLSRT